MSVEDRLTAENGNSENEAEESEYESESDEIQVIQNGIDHIEITATAVWPPISSHKLRRFLEKKYFLDSYVSSDSYGFLKFLS